MQIHFKKSFLNALEQYEFILAKLNYLKHTT